MSWPSVLQTILIGTDRRKLPEATAAGLVLKASDDPVITALEALAAAALLRKAGTEPASIAGEGRYQQPAADESERPILKESAVKDLKRMLSGSYSEGLPEFLSLMEQHGYRLPPELLPDLMDQCLQEPSMAAQLAPMLGKRGLWLAQQNERWRQMAFDAATLDWFTASFEERLQLLAATRSRNPMLTIAWLEKTWKEEKAEHKVQFVRLLKIRLSEMDLDLLEHAFQDKNRELRLAALEWLTLLPDSTALNALRAFFRVKFSVALVSDKREKYLQTTLPDLSDAELKPWFDLLSKSEKSDWRNGLLQLFLRFVPPSDLLAMTGNTPAEIVPALDGGNQTLLTEALLDNLQRHGSEQWIDAIWQHYGNLFRSPIWQKPAMQAWMQQHAESLMQYLATSNKPLDYDNQFILRALENYRKPWSKSLFNNLLQQYRRAVNGNMPGWHYALVLQIAAWHCHLPDGLAFFDAAAMGPGEYQAKEWVAFQQVLYFRKQMREKM
jgi:hypothetical protein